MLFRDDALWRGRLADLTSPCRARRQLADISEAGLDSLLGAVETLKAVSVFLG